MKQLVMALTVLTALPAAAADFRMPVKAPPAVAAVYSWSGFYIGGHVGYGWSVFDVTTVTPTNFFPAGHRFVPSKPEGFLGGGQIGFNYQVGTVVLGLEATGSLANMGDTTRNNSVLLPGAFNTIDRDVELIVTVAARLGIAVNNWLFYAKGGWAWVKSKLTSPSINAAGTLVSISELRGSRGLDGRGRHRVWPDPEHLAQARVQLHRSGHRDRGKQNAETSPPAW